MIAWQSIYTAPLDERIVVWFEGDGITIVNGVVIATDGGIGWQISRKGGGSDDPVFVANKALMWRPCPPPPPSRRKKTVRVK